MKIAIITEILSTHSGSRAPIELAKHLASNNKVTLIAYDWQTEKDIKKDLKTRGIKTILIRPPGFVFGKWLAALKFFSYLRNQDIISFHGTLPTFLTAKLSGPSLIKTYYGTQLNAYLERLLPYQKLTLKDKFFNWLGNQLILFIQRIYFGLSTQVVAISQYTAKEAKKLYGKKIPFIYLGSNSLSAKYKIQNTKYKTITILSVSRLTPYKGFHLLIEAFKKLNKKVPQARLIIVGSGPQKEYLAYLEKLKNKNVQVLTEISDQQLVRLYQKCYLYATCDRYLFFWATAS